MRPNLLLALLAISMTTFPIGTAQGQPISADPTKAPAPADSDAEARRLFDEGQSAFEKKEYKRAEEAFEGALEIRPTADTATNLAVTELKLEKHREAAEHLDWALRNLPPSTADEDRDRIVKFFNTAKSHCVSLRVVVSKPGAEIRIGSRVVGTTPLPGEVYADPGSISVTATLPGGQPATVTIEVAAGLSKSVTLEPVSQTPTVDERPIWPAILLGSLGAAGVGVGIALVVVANGKTGDLEGTRCPGGTGCEDLQSTIDDANGLQDGGIAALAIGGAALAGMGIYLGWALSGDTAEEGPSTTGFVVRPSVSPRGAYVSLEGSF